MRLFIAVLVLGSLAFGQSKPAAKAKPRPSHADAESASKPAVPKTKYLIDPLDLTTSNLGLNFQGHDIGALYNAIKNSPALKPKSEFETTAQFETRRKSFVEQPILDKLTAGNSFAFVIPGDLPVFGTRLKYDADSQTLAVTLSGRSTTFYLDSEHPALDTVAIQSNVLDRSNYIASNAYGAQVKVEKIYGQDYGVAFDKNNWLFRSSDRYSREFTYLLNMLPDQARAMKDDLRILLLCRLVDPWLRETVHGHEAKIDEPYETTIRDNYLQAVPEQLWIFNQKTGEVISKLSESSIAGAQDEQLRIKLKKTPLLFEVSSSTSFIYRIMIDEQPDHLDSFSGQTKTFGAQSKIVFKVEYPNDLANMTFKVNGKPYTPNWQKDSTKIGSYESIRSVTAVITLP